MPYPKLKSLIPDFEARLKAASEKASADSSSTIPAIWTTDLLVATMFQVVTGQKRQRSGSASNHETTEEHSSKKSCKSGRINSLLHNYIRM